MVNNMDRYQIIIIETTQDIEEKPDCLDKTENTRQLQKKINKALGYEYEFVQLIPININQYNQVYYLIVTERSPYRIKTNQEVYGR